MLLWYDMERVPKNFKARWRLLHFRIKHTLNIPSTGVLSLQAVFLSRWDSNATLSWMIHHPKFKFRDESLKSFKSGSHKVFFVFKIHRCRVGLVTTYASSGTRRAIQCPPDSNHQISFTSEIAIPFDSYVPAVSRKCPRRSTPSRAVLI